MSKIIIDVRVNSYGGSPCRLVAILDVATGNLYVSSEKPFNPVPKKRSAVEMLKQKIQQTRTLVITDSADTLDKWDLLYSEQAHLTEVVRCYNTKNQSKLLTIDQKVLGRYNPQNVLQQRRLDVKAGALWELSTETENGHICILLACWGAIKASNNFMFASQVNEDLSKIHLEPDDHDDFDSPFTI